MDLCKIYNRHSLCTALETFDADHIRDGLQQMGQNLQFSYGPFYKRRKRRPLANHVIVIVDHGGHFTEYSSVRKQHKLDVTSDGVVRTSQK